MLADRAQAQTVRRPEDEDVRADQQEEREPDHQVQLTEDRADEVPVLQELQVHVGDAVVGMLPGVPLSPYLSMKR